MSKLGTKFERNRAICDGVIAILVRTNVGVVHHLGTERKCMFTILRLGDRKVNDDSINFYGPFFRDNFEPSTSQSLWGAIICSSKHLYCFISKP